MGERAKKVRWVLTVAVCVVLSNAFAARRAQGLGGCCQDLPDECSNRLISLFCAGTAVFFPGEVCDLATGKCVEFVPPPIGTWSDANTINAHNPLDIGSTLKLQVAGAPALFATFLDNPGDPDRFRLYEVPEDLLNESSTTIPVPGTSSNFALGHEVVENTVALTVTCSIVADFRIKTLASSDTTNWVTTTVTPTGVDYASSEIHVTDSALFVGGYNRDQSTWDVFSSPLSGQPYTPLLSFDPTNPLVDFINQYPRGSFSANPTTDDVVIFAWEQVATGVAQGVYHTSGGVTQPFDTTTRLPGAFRDGVAKWLTYDIYAYNDGDQVKVVWTDGSTTFMKKDLGSGPLLGPTPTVTGTTPTVGPGTSNQPQFYQIAMTQRAPGTVDIIFPGHHATLNLLTGDVINNPGFVFNGLGGYGLTALPDGGLVAMGPGSTAVARFTPGRRSNVPTLDTVGLALLGLFLVYRGLAIVTRRVVH